MRRVAASLFLVTAALLIDPVAAQTIVKPMAVDFPPGEFSDGGQYQLADFAGKALALYFFESS